MNKHWKIEFDRKTNEIVTDEPTEGSCWEYCFSRPESRGFGVIARTRQTCVKKILKELKDDIKILKRELKAKQGAFIKIKTILDKGE